MTEKSEAELRGNVQAAIAQSDKQESQTAAQDRVNSVCGIYNCEAKNVSDGRIDLRSDGTAALFVWTSSGWYPRNKTNWKLDGNSVNVGTQTIRIFTIEQDDLIDSRGNRWIHIR
jgi:hypothetical protein